MISLFALTLLNASPQPLDVYGTWLTESGDSKIVIEDCGDGTPCGKIAWIDPGALKPEERGQVLKDINNPDESQRGQLIIGLTLLKDFEEGGKRWRKGEIYDPEEGKTYRSSLALNEDGTLSLKGCLSVICQEQTWTPSPMTEQEKAQAAGMKGE